MSHRVSKSAQDEIAAFFQEVVGDPLKRQISARVEEDLGGRLDDAKQKLTDTLTMLTGVSAEVERIANSIPDDADERLAGLENVLAELRGRIEKVASDHKSVVDAQKADIAKATEQLSVAMQDATHGVARRAMRALADAAESVPWEEPRG